MNELNILMAWIIGILLGVMMGLVILVPPYISTPNFYAKESDQDENVQIIKNEAGDRFFYFRYGTKNHMVKVY